MTQPLFRLGAPEGFELQTREIMNAMIEREWSSTRTMLAQIFVTEYHSSQPADRLTAMAAVRFGFGRTEELGELIQKELTRLCREKVLRSRISYGCGGRQRLYEVNY